jgi:hypothetical protein
LGRLQVAPAVHRLSAARVRVQIIIIPAVRQQQTPGLEAAQAVRVLLRQLSEDLAEDRADS